ncbi:MAG: hypothetical protein GDA51_12300 [Ekhidna sp.]|nr:hypothetical protein [Ekhidna sp.]MBC6410935.1 hypothetical protein [Ekhidna sp.]MBC6427214.1 hypothetical protein [Ekhidna sp.]
MCLRVIFSILFCWSCLVLVVAQDTRNASPINSTKPKYQVVKKEKKGLFGFLKKDKDTLYKTYEEELVSFRKRVSESYKENAKVDHKVSKVKRKETKRGEPFHGHKRPPKKRPPGKQKFCKVCKIKH